MKNRIAVLSGCLLLLTIFSCREETGNSVSIEKIQFEVGRKDMYVGEKASIKLSVSPKEARESKRVEYSASRQGMIAINNEKSSNEGVVFEAVSAGSVVLMAKVNGLVEYCDIKIEGDPEAAIPYISLTDYVIEMRLGTKRHVTASLQGGSPADQKNFTFSSEDDAAAVESANNTVVIDGVKTGTARITVKHPKAQYGADIVVFVLNEGEIAKYITGENVVFMQMGNGPRNYSVRMVGLQESEAGYCVYQVIEGADVITVKGSGDSCTIETKKPGIAKVEAVNQGAPYPFTFQVVVRGSGETKYISVPANFMIIEGTGYYSIGASMVGEAPDDFSLQYTYKLSKNDIINVDQTRGSFGITGLKNGIVVMTISNKYSEFDAQILIVVQNLEGEPAATGKFIRTSQQVVQMEAGNGAPDAVLKMELVGGTSADQNDFEWVVEDSSIIQVSAGGKITYTRAQVGKSYEAEAIITAKRVGTTRINIKNRKSLNDMAVIVKVYPKGTFSGQAIYLSGPGLIKVQEGKTVEVYPQLVGGSGASLGVTNWNIPSGDSSIATVSGSGLTGSVTGRKSGVTKLKVSGENIAQDYDAVVVVYREGQENTVKYAYTDNLHYRITVGQTAQIPVRHPTIPDANFSFTVTNTNKNSIYHVVSRDVLLVNGLKEGGGELVITTAGGDVNNITLYVMVEPAELVIDKPYALAGNNFAGTNVGSAVSYTVTMAGANPAKLNGIVYSIDDEKVARVKGSAGSNIEIEGVAKGQTVLRINHSESMNEKAVIVYVVEKGQPTEGKIIIGLENYNYVMNVNESLFLRLVTNATDTQKLGFKWNNRNADKVIVEDNFDTAVITARESGSAKVTVYEKDNKHLIDLDIFITVRSGTFVNGEVGFPDSVILIKNESKVMRGNAAGYLSNSADITYTFENEGIAKMTPQGLEVLLQGVEAGQTFLTVTSSRLNYYKKILVICVGAREELESLYYFTVSDMLYRIKKGEELKVNLIFGENGFPEADKALIEWSDKNNNQTVLITSPYGITNTFVGRNEGQAVVQVKSMLMAKPLEIVVEVTEEAVGSDFYKFVYDPILQLSKSDVKTIPISIYYGNQFYSDYDIYKPGIKLENGYSAIKVEVDDPSVAEAGMVGQSLRVSAKAAGKTTITLSHEMIHEDARLLIAVYAGTPPPASSELVVFIPKAHWLIPEGQQREIELQANTSSASGLNNIVWNNKNPDLFFVDSTNKSKALVTAIKEGSGTITIEQGEKVLDIIYVSVSAEKASSISVVTESIIILSMTDLAYGPYRTKVIAAGTISNVTTWKVANSALVKIQPIGSYCDLTPLKAGMTELTVSGIGYARTILVKVVNTEKEKMEAKLMNLDQRNYKLRKGETVVLNPYYKALRPSYPASATLVYDNKVAQCSQTSSGISVTGKNTGIEKIKIYNEDCENKYFEVEVEVDETVTGGFDELRSLVYLTTDQPVVMVRPGEADYYVRIGVIGQYRGGEDDFKWASNSDKVTVKAFGQYAFFTAANQEGDAEVMVSNQFCDGLPLKIKVIIVNDIIMTNSGSPYLYAGKTVYTMQRGDPDLVLPLEVRGMSPVYWNNVEISAKGSAALASFSNGNITIKEVNNGTEEITVKYKGIDLPLTLYIVVQDQFKTGSSYLTTGQNYVIINKFSTTLVNVNLVNYTEPDSAKFSWYSEDPSIACIVGNGQAVQILGMDLGVTKVTVKHPVSFNALEILVKVIPSGNSEEVCYLTTGDNVIETYISTAQGQIGVNKVGGTANAINAAWSVDNPSIVSVLGNNDIGYYTARKEGVAKITVTDPEAGSLNIVVIVRKRKPGELYLSTDNAIVQVTPNSSNNTIKAELSDADETDEINFKWEIYTQLPSGIEAARSGGSVVSIYAMGSRCSVNGIYAGTARLKVTHPKAAEALFILIQVTHFKAMNFTQKSIDMEIDDMQFVALETPDYEDYTGRVKYISDNPSVCTVYGTSKAVLVSSYMAGRAKVTAYVEDTDLQAEVEINVLAERDYAEPYIMTPRTTFVLNPRELPFIVEAQMYGFGVNDQDWDSLIWEVKNDSAGIIRIYPENAGAANKSVGRSIQAVVQNKPYSGAESCIIEISCPHLTKRIKTIFVQVSEDSNAFSLAKYDITMQSGDMAELNCNILGGRTKDYEEVIWMAEPDSFDPTKEIVRIMGRGKNVHLLAINDGVTQITAVYRGMIRVCQVKVKSSAFIGFQYQNFLTFPGERKKDKDGKISLLEIYYEVRPVNAFIQWMDTDTDFSNKIANVSHTNAKDDGTGTGRGSILIDPAREGSFSIVAVSNQKNARVNIIVKNDFQFRLDRYEIDETPASSSTNRRGEKKTPADTTVHYTVSPANVKIEPKNYNYLQLKEMGVSFIVSPAERTNEALKGIGTIYFICEKEVNIDLQLQILQTDGRPASKDVIIKLIAAFQPGEGRLVPVYEPVFGYLTITGKDKYPQAGLAGKANSSKPTGTMYKDGYYLKPVSVQTNVSSGQFPNDIYELEIGDGSTQYILLDHINPNAMVDIADDIQFTRLGTLGGKDTKDAQGNIISRNITIKKEVRENGEMAIRIDGGKDFIIYSNYGSEYRLECEINSADPNAGYAYLPVSGSAVTASEASPKTQTSNSGGGSNDSSRTTTYTVPYANGGTFTVTRYSSRTKNSEGGWKDWVDSWSPSGTVAYRYTGVIPNKPATENGWFTRNEANEKTGYLSQSTAWTWQNLDAKKTVWYPILNKYDDGNIRLNPGWYNLQGSYELYEFAPTILYEGYERPFLRKSTASSIYNSYYPSGFTRYIEYGNDHNIGYSARASFHQGGKNPYYYWYSYIYGQDIEFPEYVNVFMSKPSKHRIISPADNLVYYLGNQFHSYTGDWHALEGATNTQHNYYKTNFTVSKGVYRRISSNTTFNSGAYDSHMLLQIGADNNSANGCTGIGFNPPREFVSQAVKTYYDWLNYSGKAIYGCEQPVSMINIFKERYNVNNDTVPVDPWALSGNDKTITESPDYRTYPYRYFPVPSGHNYMGSRNPVANNIDLVSLKPVSDVPGSNYAATITITYKNTYSAYNKITINLKHRVSPAFTDNERIQRDHLPVPRIAMSWDETEEKTWDEIFSPQDLPGPVIMREGWPNFWNKLRIPKGY
jgi:hypothetical protein